MLQSQAGKLTLRTATLMAFVFCFASLVVAQVTTGSLQGVVMDPNKAVIAGATVKVTNVETGQSREIQTNAQGFYRITNLLPGNNYKIEVTASGFEKRELTNIQVSLGTENSVNINLGIAKKEEVIQVTAGSVILETTQSQLSTQYTTKQLTELPINGSLVDTLALLTPGVITPGDADFTNGIGISANGNRGRSNNFQIDGQDNNDNSIAGPSLFITNTEAVGAFQVITNNFSAEFGRNSGAQINLITKSGTNEFHGSLFEYLQNSALNTRDNVDKRSQAGYRFLSSNGFSQFTGFANRDKDPFTYNRLGGAIGGPIVKNKVFFFATYQADRQRGEVNVNNLTSNQVTFTPESATLAARLLPNAATALLTSTAVGGGPAFAKGVGQFLVAPPLLDLDGDGVPDSFLYGPGNPFGLPVTANRLAPGLFVNNGGVNTPLFFGEGVRLFRNDFGIDQLDTREDFNLTSKDIFSVRYIYDNERFPLATGSLLAGALLDIIANTNNLGATYTRTLSPRWVNEARFNYSRLNVRFGDPNATATGPRIQFSGTRDLTSDFSLNFGTPGDFPQSRLVKVYQEQDTISSTISNHAMKFGADIRQQRVDSFFLPNFLGTYVFTGGSSANVSGVIPAGTPFLNSNGTSRTGAVATAFENFLLGRPQQINFALGDPRNSTNEDDFYFFFQDDWRIRSNFTLNLGVRYEVSTQPFNGLVDKLNARESNASTAIFNTAFALSTRTATPLPTDTNNIAPRIGFAWQPNFKKLGKRFTDGRLVVRGGFGINYDPSFFNIVTNVVTAAPFAAAGTIIQTPGAPGSVSFPFLPSTTAQLNTTPNTNGGDPRLFNQVRVDPNFHNPYSMNYSFGIQQELAKNTVLEVRYVGTRIVGQFQTLNGNPDVHWLNRAAQCLGLTPGAFSNGIVVGTAASNATAACNGSGFSNRPGTTGNGRVDPNFGPLLLYTNGASGTYNGLQTRFDTRLSSQLVLSANYTFSKTIDNASEIFATLGGGQSVDHAQAFFNTTKGERGLSAFHQKHNFTANFTYEFPFFKDQKGALGKFLGGYELTSIMRFGSGRAYTPVNFLAAYDPNFERGVTGLGGLRPFQGNPNAPAGTIAFGSTAAAVLFGDITPAAGQFVIYNTLIPGSTGVAVNADQAVRQARLIYNDFGLFTLGAATATSLEAFTLFRTPYGNVGRNTLSGGPLYLFNLGLLKRTKITERYKLEFRAEANNLLNRRNFGVPDPVTEDAFNGFAVSSFQNPGFNNGSQRELRFGLRLVF